MSKGKSGDHGAAVAHGPDAPVTPSPAGVTDAEPVETAPAAASAAAEAEDVTDDPAARALEEMEARLRRVSSAYQQLQGEMAAFRERTERLEAENERRQRARVVTSVFEPVQNLRRSIEALARMDLPPDVVQGFDLVLGQFQAALHDLGLEEISTAGIPFDPTLHEALATVDVPMPAMDGMVVQVFDTGYRIGTHLVQPARVIVGRYRCETPTDPDPRCDP